MWVEKEATCTSNLSSSVTAISKQSLGSSTSPPICQKTGSSSRAVAPSAELSTAFSRSASTRRPIFDISSRAAFWTAFTSPPRGMKMWPTAKRSSSASFEACPP